MQLASDVDLAAAVDSASRVVVQKLEADWGRSGLYDHALSDLTEWVRDGISVQRDVSGTLPEETTVIEGFIGAQLSFELSGTRPGDAGDAVDLLSPLRADGPLFGDGRLGIPIRWELGLHTAAGSVPMIRQFTGFITFFRADSSSRVVSVQALDSTEFLHAPINFPVFAMSDWESNQTRIGSFRINSQWAIDYILRRNRIYQSPPPQTGCIYSVTGHGGMIPEIGHQTLFWIRRGRFVETDASYVSGRWGIAFNGNQYFSSFWFGRANAEFAPLPGRSWSIQAQVLWDGVPNQLHPTGDPIAQICTSRSLFEGNATTVMLRIDRAGTIWTEFYNGVTLILAHQGPTFPPGVHSGWKDIWSRITFGSGMLNCSIEYPGQTSSGIDLSGLSSTPLTWWYAAVVTAAPFPVQCIQICDATGGVNTLYDVASFQSQCDLDPGLNEFYSLPVVRGQDSLTAIREIVSAEFGVAGFTEHGRFFFRNRDTVRAGGVSIEKVYTENQGLTQVVVGERPGSVRNTITAKTQAEFRESRYDTVFATRAIDDFQVLPGLNRYRIVLDKPCWLFDTDDIQPQSMTVWDTPPFSSDTHKYHAIDPDFNPVTNLTVSAWLDPVAVSQGRDEAIIQVFNPNAVTVRFSTTDGRPAFMVGGLVAIQGAETVQSYKRQWSIDRYGEQTYEIDPNPWRQIQGHVQPVALGLLKDLKAPVPVFEQNEVIGDPRVQLQDTLELRDPGGIGGPSLVILEGLQRTISNGKLVDRITVRMASRPGRWILGHPELSILGSTTILG